MDAEEVAQDVFLTVIAKIDQFRQVSSLATWIHRIAVNAALMRKRRHKNADLSLDDLALPGDRAPAVHDVDHHVGVEVDHVHLRDRLGEAELLLPAPALLARGEGVLRQAGEVEEGQPSRFLIPPYG